jgi:hypothetical protein
MASLKSSQYLSMSRVSCVNSVYSMKFDGTAAAPRLVRRFSSSARFSLSFVTVSASKTWWIQLGTEFGV